MQAGQVSSNSIKDVPKGEILTPGLQTGSPNHSLGASLSGSQEAKNSRAHEALEIGLLLPHTQSYLPACTSSHPPTLWSSHLFP